MKVTSQDVRYVADLAHLELSAQESLQMERDLNSILEYIDMLNDLDTSQAEPMAQVSVDASETGTLRDDEPRPSLAREAALNNAPNTDGTFFKVPKVIER